MRLQYLAVMGSWGWPAPRCGARFGFWRFVLALTGFGLLTVSVAPAGVSVEGSAGLTMDEIKKRCIAEIARLEAQFSDHFPSGDPNEAMIVAVADAHVRRIEGWRMKWLDDDDPKPSTPFEKGMKWFEDAIEDFRAETERLRAVGTLDDAQYKARMEEYGKEGLVLIKSKGPLIEFYKSWVVKTKNASHDWRRRSRELEKLVKY